MEPILKQLGYAQSPQFLRGEKLKRAGGYGHIFRKALQDCALQGVYVLQPDDVQGITPLVYVCEAGNDEHAREIHKKVWNQNVVPFLLVKSPRRLRLYKGFSYDCQDSSPDADTLQSIPIKLFGSINRVLDLVISTGDIEQGRIWDQWGKNIQPDQRVDRVLLKSLEQLGAQLIENGVDIQTAHALIGKFVYLRYLRDRGILSDLKLQNWNIDPSHIFTRNATSSAFQKVNDELDDWLNGSVFPMSDDVTFDKTYIKEVAGIFFGDKPDGQLHLNFPAYDFSAIPTETLSSIYEQFLHTTDSNTKSSRGKKAGAYYTPIPLVDLVVNELEAQKPLEEGMKVLDPSCGSGAFLVQCYRRLIEKKLASGAKFTPSMLRELLVKHIYGVELYEDACQVAALGLILTLLDNITPPDLERYPKFKLPQLLNKNIFHADFFDPNSIWSKYSQEHEFDWIIGNPPWKKVKTDSEEEGDIHAWAWMVSPENKKRHPATDNQLAEAFIWKVRDYLSDDGTVGLVMPAMTLTKQNSRFRKTFFSENRVCSVVNLANFHHVLFQKKPGEGASASGPAAVVCFRKGIPQPDETILSYAPFAIDQIASRSVKKRVPWSIAINSSDLQELAAGDVCDGSHLHWKVAMWGSPRDMRLLKKLQGKFEVFDEFCEKHGLDAHEGFQLRDKNKSQETLDYMPELTEKKKLVMKELRGCGRIFEFPSKAIKTISESECYVRKGRGKLPYEVSSPPHIILDAARRFAIYSNEFLAVPPRQIGIAGSSNKTLLKALAAYLNSDFAIYHEFLDASEWGIRSNRATLHSLLRLPVLKALSDPKTTKAWASLYDQLTKSSGGKRQDILEYLNSEVFDALKLRKSERILVTDMVKWRLQLLAGKTPHRLMAKPDTTQIKLYLQEFQRVLDIFVGKPHYHEIVAYVCEKVVLLQIRLFSEGCAIKPQIIHKENKSDLAKTLQGTFDRLRQKHSQWLYFDRCLKIYDSDTCEYMLKPLQMSQWTRSKALCDADDLIADSIMTRG